MSHDGEKKLTCLSCNWDGWVRPSGNSGNICPNCGGKMMVGNSRYNNFDHDTMGRSEDKEAMAQCRRCKAVVPATETKYHQSWEELCINCVIELKKGAR